MAVVALAYLAPLQAQTEGEESVEAEFQEVIQVSLVDVDVYVTDSEGRPVTGLTVDDFELLVDGRPVAITHFSAFGAADPSAERNERIPLRHPSTPTDLPPGIGDESSILPEEQRPLRLILLIDNAALRTSERNRMIPPLRRFLLSHLATDDQILLIQYDRALEVVQPFTQNRLEVAEALSRLSEVSGHRNILDTQLREALREIETAETASAAMVWARNFADARGNEVRLMIRTLHDLLGSLAGLSGRKALLYVSSGLPMVPGEVLFHAVDGRFPGSTALAEIPRYDLSREFEGLASYANANGVSFYALDAGGLRPSQFGSAQYGGFSTPGLRSTLDSVVESNLQLPMRFLAGRTGGRAIVNRNDVSTPLQQVGEELRSFYSLAFSEPHPGDGRFHEIEVQVNRPDLEVRHRDGYRGKDRETRLREAVRSALRYAIETDPFGLDLEFGQVVESTSDDYRLLPMRVRIPLRNVVLLPRADGRYELRMKLAVAAIDARGRSSEIQEVPLGVVIPGDYAERAREEAYLFTHRLRVQPGRQKVAVALLDELGAQMAVLSRRVGVGE